MNFQEMKNSKSTESFCLSILTMYMNDWSTFEIFTNPVFNFLLRDSYMYKPRKKFCLTLRIWPTWIGILWKFASMLNELAGMVNEGWNDFMRSEICFEMKFVIFRGCSIKQAAFLPWQSVPYNQFLVQSILLVPEYYFS